MCVRAALGMHSMGERVMGAPWKQCVSVCLLYVYNLHCKDTEVGLDSRRVSLFVPATLIVVTYNL